MYFLCYIKILSAILSIENFKCVNNNNNIMMKSHEGGSGDDGGSRHACTIAVFLLVRLLYLLIHSSNYLFRFIQTFVMLADLINLVAVSSSITCCLLNSLLKSTFSQHNHNIVVFI